MPLPMMPPIQNMTPQPQPPSDPSMNPSSILPAQAMAGNGINGGASSAPPDPGTMSSILSKLAPPPGVNLPGVGFKAPLSKGTKKAMSGIKGARGKLKGKKK